MRCFQVRDPSHEAAFIIDKMSGLVRAGKAKWSDFAIIYRIHACSRSFEELLVYHNVPHRIIGGIGFYDRAVVKDILAYLKLVANGYDEASFIRIFNKPPRGFGNVSYNKISALKEKHDCGILEVFSKGLHKDTLKGKPSIGAGKLATLFDELNRMPTKEVQPLAVKAIEASGYYRYLQEDATENKQTNIELVQEFIGAIGEYDENYGGGLHRFLEWASLMQKTDDLDDENPNKVTLLTAHAAKGLEFRHVFVVGGIEDIFPIIRSEDNFGRPKSEAQLEADLEEERRVFFVATTRAKETLTASWYEMRPRYKDIVDCDPSRFLHEMGEAVEHTSLAEDSAGESLLAELQERKRKRYESHFRKRPYRRKPRQRGLFGRHRY